MSGLSASARTPWGRIALVWLVIALLMVLINWQNIAAGQFLDPDDTLRLVQVRDLIAGQGWFDLHQYRIDPGASPVMHWSRLVDVPLACFILLLRPVLGQPLAEHVTVVAVPLLTLLALMAIVGRMAFRLFDREIAGFACLALGFSPLLLAQFQPLRIDHHAWQIVSVLFALGALMARNQRLGGTLAGIGIAAGLMISLEVLPLAAAIGAVLLLRWLRDPAQRWWLATYLMSLALSLAALFAATRGFGDFTQYCDVVSPAYFSVFAIVALGCAGVATVPKMPPAGIVCLLGLAGAVAIAAFAIQAPQCLHGPFGNLDPLVRAYWYDNVLEGQPFWKQGLDDTLPPLTQGAIALLVTIHLWRSAEGARRAWWFDYVLLLAAALCAGLLVWRSMAFVGAMSAAPIAWLLHRLLLRYRATERPVAKALIGLAALIALMPGTPVVIARAVVPRDPQETAEQLRQSSCDLRQSALAMNALAPATIMTPLDIGPSLLERTRHSVVATSHHRAQLAMRDVILTFTGSDAQAQTIVQRHHARYLVLCDDLAEPHVYAENAPGGLAAHLLKGQAPRWLQEVRLNTPATFHVWKVVARDPAKPA
jgi:hypothetical protein